MKKIVFFISLLSIVCSVLYADESPRIQTCQLPNGLKIIHKQNTSNDIVAIILFLQGGQREEPDSQAGIAVLAQSLVTRGTSRRSSDQIALEIESCGGSVSASASEDYLLFSVQVTSEFMQLGYDVLSDIVMHPVFPEEEFEKEKEVQLNAIRTRDEDIFTAAYDGFFKELYGYHPYGRPVIGTKETLSKITRDDVDEWYGMQTYPNRALMAVAGNCDFKKVREFAQQYFSLWQKPSNERPLIFPVIIKPRDRLHAVSRTMDFKQSFLMLGYLMPPGISDDYPAVKVVNEILGGGMSRRLFQKFREEKPYTYSVGSFYPTRIEQSALVVYMGLDAKNISDAQDECSRIINDLVSQKISDQELQESKTHIIGSYTMSHLTNYMQAWYLGWWDILGRGCYYDDQYPFDIDCVMPDDITRVVKKYCAPGPVIMTIRGTK